MGINKKEVYEIPNIKRWVQQAEDQDFLHGTSILFWLGHPSTSPEGSKTWKRLAIAESDSTDSTPKFLMEVIGKFIHSPTVSAVFPLPLPLLLFIFSTFCYIQHFLSDELEAWVLYISFLQLTDVFLCNIAHRSLSLILLFFPPRTYSTTYSAHSPPVSSVSRQKSTCLPNWH